MPSEDTVEKHYAMVTLQYYESHIADGQLLVSVNLPELNQQAEQSISVTNLINLDEIETIKGERKEELAARLFERVVVEMDEDRSMSIVFDDSIEPMSAEQREFHRKKFDEEVVQNNSDQIRLQAPDPSRLNIEKA